MSGDPSETRGRLYWRTHSMSLVLGSECRIAMFPWRFDILENHGKILEISNLIIACESSFNILYVTWPYSWIG